ncbi:MAG: hypothetical protein R3A10_17960 [Caldilineaceae bacterium]
MLCAARSAPLEAMWHGPLPADSHALLAAALITGPGSRYDCLILS